jgi:molecular chaperone GrpE
LKLFSSSQYAFKLKMREALMRQKNTPEQNETSPTEEDNVEIMPSLEESLKQAELKAQEHYDAWMYAKAEGENIRRRAQEDIDKARKFALERFSSELLAVKDSLEAALAIENADVGSFKNGMELTLKQFASVLEKFNVVEINPVGEKFDPHQHQAISTVESPDAEPNTVIAVLQKGYSLSERVLRPALVTVAKPPS